MQNVCRFLRRLFGVNQQKGKERADKIWARRFSWCIFKSINDSSGTGRLGEQMRCGGKARSAELLKECCAALWWLRGQSTPAPTLAKPQHQNGAQSTEQPLGKDKIRACDVSSPRELPKEPPSLTGLLSPCYPGFSLCLSMASEGFLHCFYVPFAASQTNRALGPLLLPAHLAGGSIGTCCC